MRSFRIAFAPLLAVGAAFAAQTAQAPSVMSPTFATAPVQHDADDPAIWSHPTNPSASLIFATDKGEGESNRADGGIYAFDLNGKRVQSVAPLRNPNNIDVEYGFRFRNGLADIAVATERLNNRLLIYRIHPTTGRLTDVTGRTRVFAGQRGEFAAPMGIALYKRPKDGAVFAIVSRKNGPKTNYLWQYRLQARADGKVDIVKVREFGRFLGPNEIEAIAVDDRLGYVYYSDEGYGVHKYHADPNHPRAGRELALFARTGFSGDHEEIAIYETGPSTGYLVVTDQNREVSEFHLFKREGEPGKPHNHAREVKIVRGADSTDGLDVTSRPLGARFPNGLLAVMNSKDRNFLVYQWETVAGDGAVALKVGRR